MQRNEAHHVAYLMAKSQFGIEGLKEKDPAIEHILTGFNLACAVLAKHLEKGGLDPLAFMRRCGIGSSKEGETRFKYGTAVSDYEREFEAQKNAAPVKQPSVASQPVKKAVSPAAGLSDPRDEPLSKSKAMIAADEAFKKATSK